MVSYKLTGLDEAGAESVLVEGTLEQVEVKVVELKAAVQPADPAQAQPAA